MKPTPHYRVGQNVCRLRTKVAWTQEQLAGRAEISRRYLQRIESGERNPTVDILARLRRALDCSWSDLFKDVP
jgi:transcriptional regulator with XRE-family HTH domain